MTTFLIADDHPFILIGTKTFVESLGYHVSETCTNGLTALNLILSKKPDIAILDISMPGISGLELLERLRKEQVTTKVILLTMHNEMSVFIKAKELGAKGYVLKENTTEELSDCIQQVLSGKTYVSSRLNAYTSPEGEENNPGDTLTFAERKIIKMIAEQRPSAEIAEMLFISERTVEVHRRNIIRKLQLPKEKNALLIWALKNIK
ncbi:MAG: response regulator transcription factor [Bacteroidia bacterium]|nr:response regulator transcription factor [Bacteroidia bacterium]